jgi:UDP-N-acetyl-D-glucosamine dehydrogenase
MLFTSSWCRRLRIEPLNNKGGQVVELLQKIISRTARVAVVGMGYVGLPLTAEIIRSGYCVYGIDSDKDKVALLKQGKSYIMDTDDVTVSRWIEQKALEPVEDYQVLQSADIVVLCVPTPLGEIRQPDTSYIENAVTGLISFIKPGTLIILESTTYPGTTELLIRSRLEEELGWEAGKDFYSCFSPERVDPGNAAFPLRSTPKVIGGSTPVCLAVGRAFYETVFEQVVAVSSNEAAELTKLVENTFRSVNIAMVNELAPVCERMGVSIWEVLDSAATKPFGYMPFYPGPGIGGHCIPIDPLYLSWKSRRLGMQLKLVELADKTNRSMPSYVAGRIEALLDQEGKVIQEARIVIAGIAYKKNTDDVRESPALELIKLLRSRGADISYHDPYVLACVIDGQRYTSQAAEPSLWSESDLTVIVTDHAGVDYQQMADHAPVIFDTRNAAKAASGGRIVLLGSPQRRRERREDA